MLIWRGWGVLAAVFGFGGLVVMQLLLDSVGGSGTYQENSNLWGGLGLLIGGVLTGWLGVRWNRGEARVLVDEETGERVEVKAEHSLLWIKMEYWGGMFVAGGAVMMVIGLVG